MALPASSLSRHARRERRKRVAIICWRWTLVLLGASGVSWLIFGAIQGGAWVPIQLPTTGIAIAAAGAFAGDLMALCVSCDHYVRGEKHVSLSSLTPSFWKAWGMLTAVFIALFSFVLPPGLIAAEAAPRMAQVAADPGPAPLPDPSLTSPQESAATPPWFVVYSSQPPPPAAVPRLSTVPVFFRNNAAPETARLKKSNLVPGVSFAPEELDVSIDGLKRIIAALSACGTVPGGPATDIEIAGYASSKEFVDPVGGSTQADTDLRNAQIANRRARAAFCFVGSQTPSLLANEDEWEGYADGPECAIERSASFNAATRPLRVTVRRWPESDVGYRQMVEARKFVDRPPGVAQATFNDPEELNRRVDIHVLGAGACSAPAPLPEQTPPLPDVMPEAAPADSAATDVPTLAGDAADGGGRGAVGAQVATTTAAAAF